MSAANDAVKAPQDAGTLALLECSRQCFVTCPEISYKPCLMHLPSNDLPVCHHRIRENCQYLGALTRSS